MEREKLWHRDFIAITLINLCVFLSFQMLIPTMPVYAKSLGASDAVLGWLVGAISLASIVVRPVAGLAIDYFGRRRIFVISLLIISVITYIYGLLYSVAALLLMRVLHGVVWGVSSTTSSTIAADVIPRKRFGEGMGYFGLSTSIALAIAPAIGLYLIQHHDFKWVTGLATILIVAALIQAFVMKETAGSKKWAKGERPAMYEKAAIRPAVMMFFITGTMGAISGFVAVYAFEIGVTNIGPFFTIYAGCMIASRPFVGRAVDRYGFKAVILPGFVLMAVALFLLYIADRALIFYLAGAFFGTGFAAAQTSFQTMAVLKSPRDRVGAANGTFFTGFDGGIGFGGICAGAVADQFGYSTMYLFFLCFLAIAFLLYLSFGWKIKR